MPRRQFGAVLEFIRATLSVRGDGDSTDADLLERFVAVRDEAAFTALLQRHGPLVLSVCRRVLGNDEDVDDAFQATFLVLVRKAGSIRKSGSVASWLHGVAHRVSLEARTRAARRRTHEKRVVNMGHVDPTDDAALHELRSILDEELKQLPQKYRDPLILHYLVGKTKEETAQQLSWTEGTVSGRLARARDLLRGRLARRGVVLSAGALSVALSQEVAIASTSSTLTNSTVNLATLFAAGEVATAVGTAGVLALTERVVHTMFLTRLKITAAALLMVVAVGLAGGGLIQWAQAKQLPNARVQPPSKVHKDPEKPAAVPEKEGRTIKDVTLVLIDTQTKGISEGTEIKKIDIPAEIAANNALAVAKYNTGDEIKGTNREWVAKFAKITLTDDSVVEGQVLIMKEIGKTTLTNLGIISVMREQGNGTWYGYRAEYRIPADNSKANLAQAKKDMESLQGAWRGAAFLGFDKVIVKGNTMTAIDRDTGKETTNAAGIFTFSLDPKTKAFDLRGFIGIYELNGDDFKFFAQESLGRPKATDDKDVKLVMALKREKPVSPPKFPKEPERPGGKKPIDDAKVAPLSPLEMEAEAKAVRTLAKLGGTCTTLSDVVGKPVVGVQFVAAPIRLGGFGYREMTKEGMKEFKAFTHLKSLKLDRTDVTNESMKELNDLRSLQSLDVSHTRVTDVGLKQLKKLQGLQALALGGATVTDAGLKELKQLKSLVWLDLGNTRITDKGLKELAGFKNLQELDLSGTDATDAGVAVLRKALPKAHVIRR